MKSSIQCGKNEPMPVVATFTSCPQVKECGNNTCFYRLRDVYGMSICATADVQNKKAMVMAGADTVIDPDLGFGSGTGCMFIYCKSWKSLSETVKNLMPEVAE